MMIFYSARPTLCRGRLRALRTLHPTIAKKTSGSGIRRDTDFSADGSEVFEVVGGRHLCLKMFSSKSESYSGFRHHYCNYCVLYSKQPPAVGGCLLVHVALVMRYCF
jgi:hypothetical protein